MDASGGEGPEGRLERKGPRIGEGGGHEPQTASPEAENGKRCWAKGIFLCENDRNAQQANQREDR
jgi:hypothetical protein